MIFEDRFTVRAPIERVWAFLRDAERVARCIPGVERIEVLDDRRYQVVAGASVSFLSLSFALDVTVTEVDEPRRLVSVAKGQDARLKERVNLTSELRLEAAGPAETVLAYGSTSGSPASWRRWGSVSSRARPARWPRPSPRTCAPGSRRSERGMRIGVAGQRNFRCIDLSVPLENFSMDRDSPHIFYWDHHEGGRRTAKGQGFDPDLLPDGFGLSAEDVTLNTHTGTHMDSPWHYGPTCGGSPARGIDEIPLEWCFGDGVVLDLTHRRPGELITVADLETAVAAIGYRIKPYDIVLIRTDATKRYRKADFMVSQPGMGRTERCGSSTRASRCAGSTPGASTVRSPT